MGFILPPDCNSGQGDHDLSIPTVEFQVPLKSNQCTTSPTISTDSFNFRVEVTTCHWSSTNITDFDRLRVYFKIYNKTGSSGSFPFGENIRMEVYLVNHKDPTKSIVRTITRRIYPGLSCGWHSFAYQANFTAEEGWLDDEKKLVFRARTLVLEEDPNPLKPEWHEVRFDGRQDYDPGDEFKSPPTWKGNYKFQLAVLPGGLECDAGERGLAVYIHLLGKRGSSADFPLGVNVKFEVELVNHNEPRESVVNASNRMIYPGFGWGERNFIKRSELTKENGWLDRESKLVFRARAAIVEKDPNPLSPECHEVRFDGRQEYDPGDEFKSPPTWKGNYKFQLAVFPGGPALSDGDRGLVVYVHLLGSSPADFPLGTIVAFVVELVNHDDTNKSIVNEYTRMIYPGLGWGRPRFIKRSELTKENGWLDQEGKLVFRSRAAIVETDPNPLKPEWHEVRFDGRQEYDPGDEFKSPPTWKGNYKFQLAVFPGGIVCEDGQQHLAVYIHLLDARDKRNEVILRIKLLNHKDVKKTVEIGVTFQAWTTIHTFNDTGQSWGCPALIPLTEIKNEALGWLNGSGEIVLRAAVLPASVEGPNPREVQSGNGRLALSNGASRRDVEDAPESPSKRAKLE
ncbi:hypothetical protein FOL46_008406 [Perkinsus olseni]|uniref:MATH domain-containing protein n=1 Tax=Perkinsus olseni TaxID=32597 RepID=A0A7J6MP59_PEROL|nr:hypothetical protein FOL46_008406 [Perkinsus olseni]